MYRTMMSLGLLFLSFFAYGAVSHSASTGIDFRNFSYPWPETDEDVPNNWRWLDVPADKSVRLHKGLHTFVYSKGDASGGPLPSLRFVSAAFGKLGENPDEIAAVTLNYSTGGTANWSYLYVFTIRGNTARVIALLESGSRADGGLLKTEIRDGLLVLDFADADRRIGDCCSEGYIRVRYRLKNGAFIQTGVPEHGDLNLKKVPS